MKINGELFENSPTCKGLGYTIEGAGVDMAVIEISGRYPERGWAVNKVIHEVAYVREGTGNLTVKGKESIILAEGDVVSVAPGERFMWEGTMILVIACSPPFDSEQYKLEDD